MVQQILPPPGRHNDRYVADAHQVRVVAVIISVKTARNIFVPQLRMNAQYN